jgi:hypothetical protein
MMEPYGIVSNKVMEHSIIGRKPREILLRTFLRHKESDMSCNKCNCEDCSRSNRETRFNIGRNEFNKPIVVATERACASPIATYKKTAKEAVETEIERTKRNIEYNQTIANEKKEHLKDLEELLPKES